MPSLATKVMQLFIAFQLYECNQLSNFVCFLIVFVMRGLWSWEALGRGEQWGFFVLGPCTVCSWLHGICFQRTHSTPYGIWFVHMAQKKVGSSPQKKSFCRIVIPNFAVPGMLGPILRDDSSVFNHPDSLLLEMVFAMTAVQLASLLTAFEHANHRSPESLP